VHPTSPQPLIAFEADNLVSARNDAAGPAQPAGAINYSPLCRERQAAGSKNERGPQEAARR